MHLHGEISLCSSVSASKQILQLKSLTGLGFILGDSSKCTDGSIIIEKIGSEMLSEMLSEMIIEGFWVEFEEFECLKVWK